MSADNYYIIRKHPKGGFAAVMGFASDDRTPKVRPDRDEQFATADEATAWACEQYSEYGVSLHDEVRADLDAIADHMRAAIREWLLYFDFTDDPMDCERELAAALRESYFVDHHV